MEMRGRKSLDVSIATVNWNTTSMLDRCIDSVRNSIEAISYEMFVIDNDSHDMDFKEIVEKYSPYKNIFFIKNNTNEGAAALNRIIGLFRGRYLLVLGPDTIVKRAALDRMVRFMDTRKDAGCTSAKLLNPDGSVQFYSYRLWSLIMVFYLNTYLGSLIDCHAFNHRKRKYYLGQDIHITADGVEVEQPSGACIIVRPELLVDDGYIIDPRFPFYYNDVDLSMRIAKKGYKIYLLSSAEVVHFISSSFKQRDDLWNDKECKAGQIKYFEKYYPAQVPLLKGMYAFDGVVRKLRNLSISEKIVKLIKKT